MVRKEDIFIGTKNELIKHFREDMCIQLKDDVDYTKKPCRYDLSTISTEKCLDAITKNVIQFGKVFWYEKTDDTIDIKSCFVWISKYTTEEMNKLMGF